MHFTNDTHHLFVALRQKDVVVALSGNLRGAHAAHACPAITLTRLQVTLPLSFALRLVNFLLFNDFFDRFSLWQIIRAP